MERTMELKEFIKFNFFSLMNEFYFEVFKSGPLFISSKGIGWKSWKKRWFILTRTSLVFFKNDPGTKSIKGLALKLPKAKAKCFSTKAFKKMTKLRLLQLAGVKLGGDFEYLSKNLRWLSWNGFPLTHIPTNFCREYLVFIELENSNVQRMWKAMATINGNTDASQPIVAPTKHSLPPKTVDSKSVLKRAWYFGYG
ncbi:disease resistance protein TAO1-like isoform X2 [Vicia villosa]|uniref:disease resistance protein TAO1-like isoform X2 n=1 Tax=Vicia villosa TaxID=3911 RepID=UPI00273C2C6F|nr:disease resistance protein TAO1-like isoform X2 [Vicia villosa]